MRLLSLDYDPVYSPARRSTFSSDTSVFDYDVVLWDPAKSFQSYLTPGGSYFGQSYYRGYPSLSEHTSVRIKADATRRRTEFSEFVNAGRVLVVITSRPLRCYIDTGKREYSGTGRNRVTTTFVDPFDLLSALPINEKNSKFIQASGDRITIDGDGPIPRLLRKYQNNLAYDAIIENPPGVALARVTGTQRLIASIQRSKEGGHLILLPTVDLHAQVESDMDKEEQEDSNADENEWIEEAPEFQRDLLEAVEQLSGSRVISRPGWVEQYATKEQQALRSEVAKQQKRIELARGKLAQLQQKKEAAEAKDQLFLGTGRALELEVKSVLELLGGTVTEPEPNRDDWRVSFPEGDAVVEVKGVSKSAAEKHAAQLEKWVAATMEATGKPSKGILVVNTWRELPLDKRVQDDFPPQMLPYSEQRNHCLVTGLQLFVMRTDVEDNANRAEYWRNQLLQTSGRLDGCTEWQSIIQIESTKSD